MKTDTSQLRRDFERQRDASRREPAPTAARRRAALATLRAMVVDNLDAIADAIAADFGTRARRETELLEVVPALNAIRHARGHVARWMRPQRRAVSALFQPARAWVRREPLGVVGIIAPWNYPLLLAVAPLVDALAAGNRAMLKPSELTPAFSELLARIVADRFDPEQVTVATGGVDVAQAFSALPFDHLLFTGSTATGRLVMQAAAENLTPVTLELGGKSPAIVCPDYPIAKAARSIAFGKWLNAGQTCIAPDYVLAPRARLREVADALIGEARRAYPSLAHPDYTAIISDRHHARLADAIAAAEAGGATVLRHGDADPAGKIGPVVVLDAPSDGVLMRDEIFGPALPVIGYDDLDEAVAIVNGRDRPLALYCFSTDRAERRRVLDGATSGGVTLNGTLMHIAQDTLPFGGIGPSGIGAYHGEDGFRRFTHERAVHKIGAVNVFERLGPPWGKLAASTAKMLITR